MDKTKKNHENPLLSKRQAIKLAGVDYATLEFWISEGVIPAVPINAHGWIKIPRVALERFLIEGKVSTPAGGAGVA